jgi:hypothetical protein
MAHNIDMSNGRGPCLRYGGLVKPWGLRRDVAGLTFC